MEVGGVVYPICPPYAEKTLSWVEKTYFNVKNSYVIMLCVFGNTPIYIYDDVTA
jgi:hypothetical protein